jgi:uncharacterized protein (TIGR03437 family)
LGYAAALHANNAVISAQSPAQTGETIELYLSGLGAVNPTVANGEPAPSNPLSYTTATPQVFLLDAAGNYQQAAVTFSGLAPGYAGLYQVNITIPSSLAAGDATLEVIGEDSVNIQALLPLSN